MHGGKSARAEPSLREKLFQDAGCPLLSMGTKFGSTRENSQMLKRGGRAKQGGKHSEVWLIMCIRHLFARLMLNEIACEGKDSLQSGKRRLMYNAAETFSEGASAHQRIGHLKSRPL